MPDRGIARSLIRFVAGVASIPAVFLLGLAAIASAIMSALVSDALHNGKVTKLDSRKKIARRRASLMGSRDRISWGYDKWMILAIAAAAEAVRKKPGRYIEDLLLERWTDEEWSSILATIEAIRVEHTDE